jgi:hypothetical protein
MHKLAALVMSAALGIAGMGYTKPAEARVYVGVGIGLPGVALVAPPVVAYPPALGVYAPYYYGRPYYYGYGRVGYGFRGYGGYGVRGHGYARGFRRGGGLRPPPSGLFPG